MFRVLFSVFMTLFLCFEAHLLADPEAEGEPREAQWSVRGAIDIPGVLGDLVEASDRPSTLESVHLDRLDFLYFEGSPHPDSFLARLLSHVENNFGKPFDETVIVPNAEVVNGEAFGQNKIAKLKIELQHEQVIALLGSFIDRLANDVLPPTMRSERAEAYEFKKAFLPGLSFYPEPEGDSGWIEDFRKAKPEQIRAYVQSSVGLVLLARLAALESKSLQTSHFSKALIDQAVSRLENLALSSRSISKNAKVPFFEILKASLEGIRDASTKGSWESSILSQSFLQVVALNYLDKPRLKQTALYLRIVPLVLLFLAYESIMTSIQLVPSSADLASFFINFLPAASGLFVGWVGLVGLLPIASKFAVFYRPYIPLTTGSTALLSTFASNESCATSAAALSE